MSVADKMVAIHDALFGGSIDHAFGGALALAWCTQQARDYCSMLRARERRAPI